MGVEKGLGTPLDYEIGIFLIKFQQKSCCSLRFKQVKSNFTTVGIPLEKPFQLPWEKSTIAIPLGKNSSDAMCPCM